MNDMINKSKVLKWLEIQIADCSRELKRELFAEDLVTVSERLDTLKKVYDNIKDMTPLQFTDCTDKAKGYTKREIETAVKNNCLTIRLNLAYAEIESLRKQYNEALKTQSKQKWISCDEKLPVKWEEFPVFTEREDFDIAFTTEDALKGVHDKIQEMPVKQGKWKATNKDIPPTKQWLCSCCNGLIETTYYCWNCYYNFCPNCGAEMKRGKENE